MSVNSHKSAPALRLPGGLDWPALVQRDRKDDSERAYRVLVADLVGLTSGVDGAPDASEFATHLALRGAAFHDCRRASSAELSALLEQSLPAGLHFFYQPNLSREDELLAVTAQGQFDAVMVAATVIPAQARFCEGAVRIGAGTGNMGSDSWGGAEGARAEGASTAPLMNTPSFNSRATAQMLFKALLRIRPNLDVDELYERVQARTFDTGKNLGDFPTEKLEGQRIGVLGFGNIGREVAKLARAFGMRVAVYARPSQQRWVESEGFEYCASVIDAAYAADVLTPHLGLGPMTAEGFANAGIVNAQVLSVLAPDAVLINYDRGELVDVAALNDALSSKHLAFAAIDADVFLSGEDQSCSGPLVPYLALLDRHADRLQLLPHAAADTDHRSRCAGARQAADQLIAAICYRCVANLKGETPAGYENLGAHTLPGVGSVGADAIAALAGNSVVLADLREQVEVLTRWLGAVDAPAGDSELVRHGIEAANRITTQLATLGLLGPARDL